jgi:hypothetical protein
MAVETDTQRAIYFDTDEFGQSATFTDVSAGTSSTVKGIFDKDSQEIVGMSDVGLIEDVPTFHCVATDVSVAVFDDTLLIDSVTYKIKKIEPDGTGMTKLTLSK